MEWRIRGYDTAGLIFSLDVPEDKLSHERVAELLRLMVARHLTMYDVGQATLEKNELLRVRTDRTADERLIIVAGENPQFAAGLFRMDDEAWKTPALGPRR